MPSLKQRLAAGEPLLGAIAFLASPDAVELLAVAGFDYVVVDLEHSATNPETALHMVRAAKVAGVAALVRVRDNEDKLILQALEMGADGIVVPFVQSADDVRKAARSMRYPPEGVRGMCPVTRSARFGTLRSQFAQHAKRLNDETVLVALIENMKGADAIGGILDCDPGIDALLVGRSDLSADIGCIGQGAHPDVLAATKRIIDAAAAHPRGVRAGVVLGPTEESAPWLAAGCRFMAAGTDSDLLLKAAAMALDGFRKAIPKR